MKLTKSQLRNIIRETIKEVEFRGETPAGQLTGTEEEDARFRQQLKAEKIMKRAGLDSNERSFVFKALADGPEADQFLESPAYEKLLGYFMDTEEMPYGVAKARTGDPDYWILDYLAGNQSGASLAAEHKNKKIKITKTRLRNIVQEELDAMFGKVDC